MTHEIVHMYVRFVAVIGSTIFLVLLTRSLVLAFRADYGWPRRRPGVNGRSELDGQVLQFIALLAILGLISCVSAIERLVMFHPLPINPGSLLVTGYMFVFFRCSFLIWRLVRRERLAHKR